jgi:hypothetical protein
VEGEIYRQTYDDFDYLDHTGGLFDANGELSFSDVTRGNLGYRYRRRLQGFTNKNTTEKDVIDRHTVRAGVERTLAQRWQGRLGARWADVGFSNSKELDKNQYDGEAEIEYAASQNSIFGLLATYTKSEFDTNSNRDFSGWSLGPSFDWQIRSNTLIDAHIAYTERSLDDSGSIIDDYDGITGHLRGRWTLEELFETELRVFRDVTSLGGEIAGYTERTGVEFKPSWQITSKLLGTFGLGYEERDFDSTGLLDRKDEYYLANLGVEFAMTDAFLVTAGYAYEERDSNVPQRDFEDHTVNAELRLNF